MSKQSLLSDVLYLPNLRAAWKKVQENHGGPGVDAISLRRFQRDWEKNLVELQQAVRGNTYKAKRLRRFRRPKPDGGWRVISVPTVADRVLQRAVLNVLEIQFDRTFLPCSFGYRPRRCLQDAVDKILEYRDAGQRCVLDADIDAFFDSLDHELLMQFLREDISDAGVLNLIALWLKVGCRHPEREVGTPLGAVISPLLSNVYLHRLDRVMCDTGLKLVRYADDFVVLCGNQGEAQEAQRFVGWALQNLRLKFEPTKTRVTCFDEGFDFLGVHFEGETYSYLWKDKRVTVKGDMDVWSFPYPPEGY